MKQKIHLVPGPVQVPQKNRDIYLREYGSPDLEPEFLELYASTQNLWQNILETKNDIVIMTGEATLGLWSSLKSCIVPGDKVLAIDNGVFGNSIAEMARNIGANVETIQLPYDTAIYDFAKIEKAIANIRPKMITAVHCETPAGILNSLKPIGQLKKQYEIPLFYVDAVTSIGNTPVNTDDWNIDICLGSGAKAPSIFPDITFLAVSDAAWNIIDSVNYSGYDALKPFHHILANKVFPYTPHWHGIAALNEAAKALLADGLENTFARHQKVASFCRQASIEMGLQLYPKNLSDMSPAVTAIKIPAVTTWEYLDKALREQNMFVGGSLGILANKVFRIGHIGAQANLESVKDGMSRLQDALNIL